MGKKENIKEKAIDKLSLPKDILLDIPSIRIVGNKEIIIENHMGVCEYNEKNIVLASSLGNISLVGEGFQIKDINQDSIHILGKINFLDLGE